MNPIYGIPSNDSKARANAEKIVAQLRADGLQGPVEIIGHDELDLVIFPVEMHTITFSHATKPDYVCVAGFLALRPDVSLTEIRALWNPKPEPTK